VYFYVVFVEEVFMVSAKSPPICSFARIFLFLSLVVQEDLWEKRLKYSKKGLDRIKVLILVVFIKPCWQLFCFNF